MSDLIDDIRTKAPGSVSRKYKLQDLLDACTKQGLDSTGKKDDLVSRLRAHVGAAEKQPTPVDTR